MLIIYYYIASSYLPIKGAPIMDKRCSSSTASPNGKKTPEAKTISAVANILPKLKFSHCKHPTPVPDGWRRRRRAATGRASWRGEAGSNPHPMNLLQRHGCKLKNPAVNSPIHHGASSPFSLRTPKAPRAGRRTSLSPGPRWPGNGSDRCSK